MHTHTHTHTHTHKRHTHETYTLLGLRLVKSTLNKGYLDLLSARNTLNMSTGEKGKEKTEKFAEEKNERKR